MDWPLPVNRWMHSGLLMDSTCRSVLRWQKVLRTVRHKLEAGVLQIQQVEGEPLPLLVPLLYILLTSPLLCMSWCWLGLQLRKSRLLRLIL